MNNIKLMMRAVFTYAKKHVVLFVIAEICIVISYIVSLLLPINLTILTDDVLYGEQYHMLSSVIINYIVLFIIASIFNLLYGYVWQTLNNRYIVEIKNTMFKNVMKAPAKWISEMNSGDVMTRIDADAEQFLHVIQRNVFHFLNSIVLCIGIIVIIASTNLIIAIVIVIAAFIPIVITRVFGKITEKYAKKERETTGEINGFIYQLMKGFKEIKIFRAAKWAKKKLFLLFTKQIDMQNRMTEVDFKVNKLTHLINLITSLCFYAIALYFILQGEITIGVFLALIQYVALLHKKFNWILRIYLEWKNRKTSIERVLEILNLAHVQGGNIMLKEINSIEFKNVNFRYKEAYILDNLSFIVNKKDKVAIVGNSGVGKTTVLNLLTGLYQPNDGNIYINNIAISEYCLNSLRENMKIFSQEIFLFEDSIKNNVTLFNEYSDEEIYTAFKQSEILEVIEDLPKQIETKISEQTTELSTGQKQRLMFTRMFLTNGSLIILDEATASLDVKTEEKVLDNLFEAYPNDIFIIVSHRENVVKRCNKIISLNNK